MTTDKEVKSILAVNFQSNRLRKPDISGVWGSFRAVRKLMWMSAESQGRLGIIKSGQWSTYGLDSEC